MCAIKHKPQLFTAVLTVLINIALSHSIYAQLAVAPNQTATVLASALAGPGITISSPTLSCPGQANGLFTVTPGTILGTGTTLFGIGSGIILTTGKATGASGPESTLANTNNGAAGDAALNTLAGSTTHDACILEFDFSVVGDTVRFNYQFGSEEYNKSTCGPYNDAFAFFISGPGIPGTDNMALVPGTTIPVTVNSVNSGIPGTGYTLANCTSMGAGSPFTSYYVDNTGGANFTYKGYTTKMSAVHKVIPCNTYHLKLTIADAGNSFYDSGVFIEAGSLTTPSISGASSVCVGNTATLSDPIAGGTWSSSNTTVATINPSTGYASGISAGTATITYSFGPGCYVTTPFTVNPLPSAISGASQVCVGSSITLSNTTPGGIWTSTNTAIATIHPATGIVTGNAPGTVTINYTTGAGCTASTTISVSPIPAVITGSATLCTGDTTILSCITPGGIWTSSNPSVALAGSTSGKLAGVSGGMATITYTIPTGCYRTTSATIKTVYKGVVSAGICPGQTYIFGGTTYSTAGSYTHTFPTAYCDSIVTLNLSINPTSSTELTGKICEGEHYAFGGKYYNTPGDYTYHTTNMYGCDSAVKLHLIVAPIPSRPNTAMNVYYCLGQPAVPLKAAGKDLLWYSSYSDMGATVPPTPNTGTTGTYLYYVSQTADGCESVRDTIAVTVYPTPDATISPRSATICRSDTVRLTAAFQNEATYTWSLPKGVYVIHQSTPDTVTIKCDTTGYLPVILTVKYPQAQCTNADTIKVHAVTAPELQIQSRHDVCIGDTVVVAVQSATDGITNYTWHFGDASILSATDAAHAGPFKLLWVNSGTHTIEVNGQVGDLCRSADITDTIMVHQDPEAGIIADRTDGICIGDSILFSVKSYNYDYFYTWTPEHFFNNLNQKEIYGRIELPGYVRLTVQDPFGCTATDQVLINAKNCCNVSFPTLFTPNGDGKNDVFRPITPGNHAIHIFRVANRWGQTVFETSNERYGWDGTFNGIPQDIGTYFYYISYDCNGKTIEEKGDVTLAR